MGSYKWGYKSGNYTYHPYEGIYHPPPLIITTHEPPSRFMGLGLRFRVLGSRKMARIAQGSL